MITLKVMKKYDKRNYCFGLWLGHWTKQLIQIYILNILFVYSVLLGMNKHEGKTGGYNNYFFLK